MWNESVLHISQWQLSIAQAFKDACFIGLWNVMSLLLEFGMHWIKSLRQNQMWQLLIFKGFLVCQKLDWKTLVHAFFVIQLWNPVVSRKPEIRNAVSSFSTAIPGLVKMVVLFHKTWVKNFRKRLFISHFEMKQEISSGHNSIKFAQRHLCLWDWVFSFLNLK